MSALYCRSWSPQPDRQGQKARSVSDERGAWWPAGRERGPHTSYRFIVPAPTPAVYIKQVTEAGVRTYLLYDITVSVTGCQVQGRVIPTVHDIDSCPSHDQHLNHSRAAFSAGPVQGGEAVIVPLRKGQWSLIWRWDGGRGFDARQTDSTACSLGDVTSLKTATLIPASTPQSGRFRPPPPPPRHPDTSIGFTVLSPSLSPTSLSFLACPIWLGQPSSSGFLCALCIICGSFQFPLHLAHPLPQCLSDL